MTITLIDKPFFSTVVLVFVCLIGLVLANPVTETPEMPDKAANPNPAAQNANQTKNTGCSSSPYEPNPCGLTEFPGVFSGIKDARQYQWIFMTVCIVAGCCIFTIVIAAAIYNRRIYARKQAEEEERIRQADEAARAAMIH